MLSVFTSEDALVVLSLQYTRRRTPGFLPANGTRNAPAVPRSVMLYVVYVYTFTSKYNLYVALH